MKWGDVKDMFEVFGIVGGLFVSGGAVTVWWKRITNGKEVTELKIEVAELKQLNKEQADKILILEKQYSEMMGLISMTSTVIKDHPEVANKLYKYVIQNQTRSTND